MKKLTVFAIALTLAGAAQIGSANSPKPGTVAYNGDTYCGSYENPCICDEVDEYGNCKN